MRLLQRVLQTLSGTKSAAAVQRAVDAKLERATAAIERGQWNVAETLLDELAEDGSHLPGGRSSE